jgi:beta-mannosidase
VYQQSLNGIWQLHQADDRAMIPGPVPGDVHMALLAAGRIPDPFIGDNELAVQWVHHQQWVYRRTVTPDAALLDHDRHFLHFGGLDTLATVTLNGETLGHAANMFHPYRWEVTGRLLDGENEVVVTFASAVDHGLRRQAERPLIGQGDAIPGNPYVRKAPSHYGWDWGPQLPPTGIWQDVALEGRSGGEWADCHLRQRHHDGQVTLSAAVTASCWSATRPEVHMTVHAPDGAVIQRSAALLDGETELTLTIATPALWWPNTFGAQPLYAVELALVDGGQTIDSRHYQIGLRTIAVEQKDDVVDGQPGRSFTFIVNGVPLFAKGANWIPADSFPTRISREAREHLIRSAADANMNMLRVWGGGYYEDEHFYDLCDRYGILVWQDFMFGCAIYPHDEAAFLAELEPEVDFQVKRLRHRAALAIWCGNNEMEEGWVFWGWDTPERQGLKRAYERYFYHTLAAQVQALDPDRLYWPSSPTNNIPFDNPRSNLRGDAHYWEVWHQAKPFTAYRQQYPRFMSEFGFQSLPTLPTVASFAPDPRDWNMTSYIMERHQKNSGGNARIVAQMLDNFRLPKDFEALVYTSLVLQAEGIRYGVEHWRRHRNLVSGTLFWQLNDCWPVASWSSIDYAGRWKALQYAAKRFYAPLLLTIEDRGTTMDLAVTNDLPQSQDGVISWFIQTLGGESLANGTMTVQAAGVSTTLAAVIDCAPWVTEQNRREIVFVAELHGNGVLVNRQLATFAPNKYLALQPPAIATQIAVVDDQITIRLQASTLARFVELSLHDRNAQAMVIFSDNYFDLPAGVATEISCPLPTGMDATQAQQGLRVRSLYDSYAG